MRTKRLSTFLLLICLIGDVAENTVVMDASSLTNDKRLASANVHIDDDLYNLRTLTFRHNKTDVVYTKLSAKVRTRSNAGQSEVTWSGLNGPHMATLVRGDTGRFSGQFSTDEAYHTLVTLPNGNLQMQQINLDEIKVADADIDGLPSEHVEHYSFESEPIFEATGFDLKRPAQVTQYSVGEAASAFGTHGLRGGGSNRILQVTSKVDIYVVATNRAMCEFGMF